MISHRSLLFAIAGCTAVAGTAAAQTPPQGREFVVDDVIVTGAPFGVTDRASLLAVDVLDEEDLAVAPAATLGDLVAGLPGVRSTNFAPGASRPVIRGLSGPRVQVLTNGLGMIDASSVSPDHQVAVDPAEARRIEIVRGPSTLVFGGSAIGGVVNIIDDRIPTERPEGGLDGHVSAQASTVDDGSSFGARLKAEAGPLVITLDGFTRVSSDYRVPVFPESQILLDEEGEAAGDGRTVENTFVRLDQYGAGLSFIGSRGYGGVSAKHVDTTYGVPGHEHEPDPLDPDPHEDEGVSIGLEQTRYDLRGELSFASGPFSAARLSAGWADYAHTEFEGDEVGTQFFSDGYEGRFELIQRERNGWQGVVGAQLLDRTFDAVGDEAYVPRTGISEQGLYTVQRFDRGGLGFEGGLRLDKRSLESAAAERDFTNVSASAGVFFRPSAPLFVGVSVARNARAPSEVELFAEGAHVATGAFEVGDIDLDSEVASSVEATLHFARGPFEFDLHAYHAQYDGFIDLRPTGLEDVDSGLPIFEYVQTDATFRGFEAEAEYRLWESGQRSLTLTGAADSVRASTDLGPAARIPPWSVTGGVEWASRLFDIGMEVRHVGEQDRTTAFERPTASYTFVNLKGAMRPFADRNVTLFAEASNLTDEEGREHASFQKDIAPLPGRSLRAGVTWRF
ncbi:TonB-dependent receptor [Brevundimonas basaltis]|uniref:Iron complex outermembrane receptor protein n=1 Tax=Brevundimonas basaltis TaxID=472166 RepID=A0A7W8HYZ5_9CAUL|nr:TonB-dependent receptor [Brevundimonas basaltis]MBB5291512.1 iron complex outermembrane receptor protein [Brevundimonas basaltis]